MKADYQVSINGAEGIRGNVERGIKPEPVQVRGTVTASAVDFLPAAAMRAARRVLKRADFSIYGWRDIVVRINRRED